MNTIFRKFFRATGGNVVLLFALSAPVLLGVIGLALDYVMITKKHAELQAIADGAAVGSAHELPLANSNEKLIVAVAKSYVNTNLGIASPPPMAMKSMSQMAASSAPAAGGSSGKSQNGVSTKVEVVDKFTGVRVTLEETWTPFFAHFLTDKATPIVVTARANILSGGLICVVGLMQERFRAAIHLDDNASIDAVNCGIYSNAPSRFSIRLDRNASIKAKQVCSAGGYVSFGSGTSISPKPITDCPPINDPLAKRIPPTFGSCDFMGLEVGESVVSPPISGSDAELLSGYLDLNKLYAKNTPVPMAPNYKAAIEAEKVTLSPGVYCGGLFIGQNQNVTLLPGEYVIKDGPLVISGNAVVKGEGVGFFLTGKDSIFDFQADTTIDLVAPKSGSLAGMLFYEDRDVPHGKRFNPLNLKTLPDDVRLHRIRSDNAHQLLGTIYLPRSILMIDANAPVADKSAYTAIITWRLWLRDGPSLHLNADYKATDVPVPSSLVGGQIVLAE